MQLVYSMGIVSLTDGFGRTWLVWFITQFFALRNRWHFHSFAANVWRFLALIFWAIDILRYRLLQMWTTHSGLLLIWTAHSRLQLKIGPRQRPTIQVTTCTAAISDPLKVLANDEAIVLETILANQRVLVGRPVVQQKIADAVHDTSSSSQSNHI